jgi:Na+/H+ antiporter NhaD/arsenite permease-like protein
MLLTIAIAPLVAEHFWENNRNKLIFTAIISVITVVILSLPAFGLGGAIVHNILYDYIPFVMLLLALFVVTGGIRISGDITATPVVNTFILGMGFVMASLMGTTGAAMLLIRPLLQINQQRVYRVHTILFFIALVANCGGLLTPLGDPPLFLLYLRGAEFSWFQTLFPQWALLGSMLMAIYLLLDTYYWRVRNERALFADHPHRHEESIHIAVSGVVNVFLLSGILLSVAFLNPAKVPAMGEHDAAWYMRFLREIVLAVILLLSLILTRPGVRRRNHFSWEPISEVAILFIGIFVTMTPALLYLNANAASLGIDQP